MPRLDVLDSARLNSRTVLESLRAIGGSAAVDLGPGDLVAVEIAAASRRCLVVSFDYERNHGSIGVQEATQLVNAFRRVRNTDAALALVLDTSGIRVTDGIAGIASLRMILREALDARLDGKDMLAVATNHTFGGASMLASLCELRLIDGCCAFAMSGPKLIAHSANPDSDDLGTIGRLISGTARASCSTRFELMPAAKEALIERFRAWLCAAPIGRLTLEQLADSGRSLERRLLSNARAGQSCDLRVAEIGSSVGNALRAFFGDGYDVDRSHSIPVVSSKARRGSWGFILQADRGVGARQALTLAQALIDAARPDGPGHCLVILNADGHSSSLFDERFVLSEYLAHLALVMRALHRQGLRMELVVAERGGGGIQAALGAGATSVTMMADAQLFVLPPFAMGALNKAAFATPGSIEEAVRVGAADGVFETSDRPWST
ncbi:hypothetical protein [Bradyrhizobium sp. PRIMUS42]|uniref:hypothetical protein n=1 Tax=Bradyrhizobium sp. PRIMUS42 TaxID=2908926 RepID=UPI001FF69A0A|nr:hypothetical protein [Bradyrhizobium sp. PRIMUS42]MCJ9728650.1 hypothetical protein [Bradyrhizobium sp. PRIMUS42]